jgi:phosphoribosylformimino-5-aminoimidazole carboxamide ribonucleotide (ProFAR) isomerase
VLALDVREGEVRAAGWTRGAGIRYDDALALIDGSRVLVTAIDRDGTLGGPDLELVRQAAGAGGRVLAAGGIRSVEDVAELAAAGAEAAIVGRALLVT